MRVKIYNKISLFLQVFIIVYVEGNFYEFWTLKTVVKRNRSTLWMAYRFHIIQERLVIFHSYIKTNRNMKLLSCMSRLNIKYYSLLIIYM